MEFEADRMTGLVLTDEIVAPERDVVLEERRMHCDTDPGAQLGEAVQATLFTHHPYGVPIIGWGHEIEGLKREDALAYYQRFYTPENAILVVAGDAEPEETLALAEDTYGKVKPRGARPERVRRARAPDGRDRLVTVSGRQGRAAELAAPLSRPFLPHREAPANRRRSTCSAIFSAAGRRACSIATLVIEEKLAVSAWAYYHGTALDESRFIVNATPAPDVTSRDARQGVRPSAREIPGRRASTPARSNAPRRAWWPTRIYARDSQSDLARWYGSSLAIGQTIREVEEWPAKIEAVDAEAVLAAARRWLDRKPAVTGHLLPLEAEAA